jgi:hypothetical protein
MAVPFGTVIHEVSKGAINTTCPGFPKEELSRRQIVEKSNKAAMTVHWY